MSKMMFSVYDLKAETWSFPFQSENNATAIREFQTLVADGRTLIGQHPEDFDLFFLGSFSFKDGSIKQSSPVKLANGHDLVVVKE